jgi:hypothetical protein
MAAAISATKPRCWGLAASWNASAAGIGVDVASSDPAHTKRVEPGFRYYQYVDGIMGLPAKLHAHMGAGYIIPGGTPIMDNLGDWPLLSLGGMLQHAGNWGKPAAFVGVGVEQLRHDISRQSGAGTDHPERHVLERAQRT